MRIECRTRHGFTLIEVVVATVMLAVGVLALAAGATAAVRSMADSARIMGAARAAEAERERIFATSCAAGAGVDSVDGARITWTASPMGSVLSIQQSITLPRTAPGAVDIAAAGACR